MPHPGRSSATTSIVPPMAVTSDRETKSPIPDPVPPWRRAPRSNTASRVGGGIPAPPSLTVITA